MKPVLKLIIFLIYTIVIFFIQDIRILLITIGINVLLAIYFRVNLKKALSNLWGIMGFILFTAIINVLVVDVTYGIMIAIKLMIVCNITYIFSNIISYSELANAIERLLSPLRIIKVDTKNIGIMISIAICFIPILKDELSKIKEALVAKGCNVRGIYIISKANVILLPMFISILNRMNEIEDSLKSKAWE